MGVIDQPLPADGGAGFLEIDPHHHLSSADRGDACAPNGGGVVRAASTSWTEQGPTITSSRWSIPAGWP
jgi:hypothetical protein